MNVTETQLTLAKKQRGILGSGNWERQGGVDIGHDWLEGSAMLSALFGQCSIISLLVTWLRSFLLWIGIFCVGEGEGERQVSESLV